MGVLLAGGILFACFLSFMCGCWATVAYFAFWFSRQG